MKAWQQLFLEHEEIQSIVEGVNAGLKEQVVAGLTASSRSLMISSVYSQSKKPMMVLTHNLLQAQKLYEDLVQILSEQEVFLYPANEMMAAEMSIASPELKAQRLETLHELSKNKGGVFVVPVAGLRKILPSVSAWQGYQLSLTVGEEVDVNHFLLKLVQMGYERAAMVASPGEFSLRGGILDVYPLTANDPIRIELFDTEIDSIRTFSVDDQRSKGKHEMVWIGPATEYPMGSLEIERLIENLEDGLPRSLKKINNAAVKERLIEQVDHDLDQLKQGQMIEKAVSYASLAYENPASLLDYLGNDSVVFIDEFSRIQEISDTFEKDEAEWYTSMLEEGQLIHGLTLSYPLSNLMLNHDHSKIFLSLFLRHVPNTQPQNIVNLSCKPMQSFHGQMSVVKTEWDRWKKSGYTVLFLAPNEERAKRLENVFDDYDMEVLFSKKEEPKKGLSQIAIGSLNGGFEIPILKLAVITEIELFNKKTQKSARRQKLSNAERIKSYSELKMGDYVVHVNHGIGRYLGIETLNINGLHKDYLHIKYTGTDKLYVPVDQIDLVQKYVGSEGKEPKLYKLGGTEWKRVKSKVHSSVQDIADDLIKLYAEREASVGYPFSPDGDMQRQFESSFQYQETEDQLRSIQEIKLDMEKERPMDRLLCGDVGYGKTEVAIRAAFKAILDGKQVAFLVPTTILAQQHYETMKERFQDYPVSVSLLSRFRSKKQMDETKKGLKAGTVDIVVGTHRLLSKDVQYKDLGLLIIDEEQRFGVTHKEKVKQLKTNVDVLTLTATPIPRTLHMSMLGVRDLSVIETPPENRFPVQTYVMEYNGVLVKEAIERELARDGQVYYLYNRVEDIERKADEISMLVPEARVAYAHGRMSENELESVIVGFLEGEFDVLVTTTIIETGVDIPNVNTLLVHDADRMGLSQLYQLRGRVGRSNRIAYAYFTYRKDKVLTEVAEKRLKAIKEFTELGSGFKIAMRDLSIRGAGNLLGAQQHGFIDSVGFDLYSQMLNEAIEERKGDAPKRIENPFEIDLDIDAYIPDLYIPDGHQKIEMYKRFRAIETIEDTDELRDEMIDRFGDYPEEVQYLYQLSEMKVYSKETGLSSIKQQKDMVTVLMSEEGTKHIDGARVFNICQDFGRIVGLGMEGTSLKITIQVKGLKTQEWVNIAHSIIRQLPEAKKENSLV